MFHGLISLFFLVSKIKMINLGTAHGHFLSMLIKLKVSNNNKQYFSKICLVCLNSLFVHSQLCFIEASSIKAKNIIYIQVNIGKGYVCRYLSLGCLKFKHRDLIILPCYALGNGKFNVTGHTYFNLTKIVSTYLVTRYYAHVNISRLY